MTTETEPIHTMEDDITFEKMKHMPKRTSFYTAHRKLSWQCDRDVKQVERDKKLVSGGLARAQSSMADRFAKLQETKKQLGLSKASPGNDDVTGRRQSDPFMVTHHQTSRPKSEERLADSNSGLDDDDAAMEHAARRYCRIRRSTVAEGATDAFHLPTGRRFTVADIHNPFTK